MDPSKSRASILTICIKMIFRDNNSFNALLISPPPIVPSGDLAGPRGPVNPTIDLLVAKELGSPPLPVPLNGTNLIKVNLEFYSALSATLKLHSPV